MSEESTPQAPENLVDLLNKLIPPPEPAPISLVPQTFGWVVLAVGLVILVIVVALRMRKRHADNAYRRAALEAVQGAVDDPERLAHILRATALSAFPRVEVAALHGDDWLRFLDKTYGGDGFLSGPGRFVASAPYDDSGKVTADGVAAVRNWITAHRREGAT